MTTVYRIKRTKLLDSTHFDGREEGHVSYLELFVPRGTGRKYRFRSEPRICAFCDYHSSLDFATLAEAKKKLRCAAVQDHFQQEISWDIAGSRIEVVEVTLADECVILHPFDDPPIRTGHKHVKNERVLWPTPPVLERMANI